MIYSNQKLALFITHNIFLTEENRDKLLKGESIKAVGVSVPVWVFPNGQTTEPAYEVFCEYIIHNDKLKRMSVKNMETGYEIFLPQTTENWEGPPPIDFKAMGKMDEAKRRKEFKQRNLWWKYNKQPPSVIDLKPIPKGGSGCLKFELKENGKINNEPVMLDHIVEIKIIDQLTKSLVN